jgi:hypothetical protein
MAVRATLGQPPVFAGLLGGRGTYTVTPADPWHVWGGYYETGSLIWRSRWAGSSRTECREALALPADPHRVVILRRIEAVDGPARVKVVLDVRARSGRSQMTGRPGAAQGRQAGTGTGRRPGGAPWPTRYWPASATRCMRPAAGSARPKTHASMPPCCCR